MEPVRIHARRRSQQGGGNGMAPLKPEKKMTSPLSGPTDRAPGRATWLPPVVRSNAEPAGRASASCPAADLRLWHTTTIHEQCKGMCIAAHSARESRGLVVMLVSGWVQKRESR
eukprot:6819872-Prymnesium_polylepis.1